MKEVKSSGAPAAIGPYSQAVAVGGGEGGFLFVSGQIPVNPADGTMADSVSEQAEQAFRNLKNIVEAAGSSLDKAVKTTLFIRNMGDFQTINEIYARFFAKVYPARSCVEVSALPKGALIEAEAIVALG